MMPTNLPRAVLLRILITVLAVLLGWIVSLYATPVAKAEDCFPAGWPEQGCWTEPAPAPNVYLPYVAAP